MIVIVIFDFLLRYVSEVDFHFFAKYLHLSSLNYIRWDWDWAILVFTASIIALNYHLRRFLVKMFSMLCRASRSAFYLLKSIMGLLYASRPKKKYQMKEKPKIKSVNLSWMPKLIQPIILRFSFNITIPYFAKKQHISIVSKSGGGKSENLKLMIKNDLNYNGGILLFDPHSEMSEDILSLKIFEKKQRDRVVYISPEFEDYLPCYNPLQNNFQNLPEFTKRSNISVKAKNLVAGFETIFGELSSPMSNMITMCFVLLMEYEGSTMIDFLNLLNNSKIKDYETKINNHWNEELKVYFNSTYKDLNSTKQALYNKFLDLFGNQYVKFILCGKRSTFDVPKLLDDGKIVVLNLSQGILSQSGCQALGSLILADVTSFALSRGKKGGYKRPIWIYLDESHLFMSVQINRILEQARKYSVYLTMVNQHLGQISNFSLKSSIQANTGIKMCGLSSHADKVTIAKQIGIDVKAIPKLKEGKFLVGINEYAKIIKFYDFLVLDRKKLMEHGDRGKINRNYMRLSELKKLKNEQIGKYYQKIDDKSSRNKPTVTVNPQSKSEEPKYERFNL